MMVRSLAFLLTLLAPCCAMAADFAELTQLAEGALRGQHVRRAVPGFEVLVLREGQSVYHQAFGDWRLNQPAKIDSSTKTLSGALVMSVCETGERGFSLDSQLGDFLPEFNKRDLRNVTIRQAFSHTSGIAGRDAFSPVLRSTRLTLRQSAALISRQELQHGPPGSTFAYGGLSMQATGAAMEIATGKPFVELFSERIARPLHMDSTGFYIASEKNPRVAGGVKSTASDFARFMDMLLNHGVDRSSQQQVLKPESVRRMLTRQTRDDQTVEHSPTDNHRYGVGVWLDQLPEPGPPVDAMAGGARGFHAWIDRERGLVLVFSTDRTLFANIEELAAKMRAATVAAFENPTTN